MCFLEEEAPRGFGYPMSMHRRARVFSHIAAITGRAPLWGAELGPKGRGVVALPFRSAAESVAWEW